MEEMYLTTVAIPTELYEFMRKVSKNLEINNVKYIAQLAYSYCNGQRHEEEMQNKLALTMANYNILFVKDYERTTVHLKVTDKDRKEFNLSKLITLYILVYLKDYMNMINEEFITNVKW